MIKMECAPPVQEKNLVSICSVIRNQTYPQTIDLGSVDCPRHAWGLGFLGPNGLWTGGYSLKDG